MNYSHAVYCVGGGADNLPFNSVIAKPQGATSELFGQDHALPRDPTYEQKQCPWRLVSLYTIQTHLKCKKRKAKIYLVYRKTAYSEKCWWSQESTLLSSSWAQYRPSFSSPWHLGRARQQVFINKMYTEVVCVTFELRESRG